MILRVGSRGSELAVAQSRPLVDQLDGMDGVRADLKTSESVGDEQRDRAIEEIGQTAVFTSALDEQVLEGRLETAVHSLKDCETDLPEGLMIGAIPPRLTPFDMILGLEPRRLGDLPEGTVIGTSSRRRRANLLYHNAGLEVRPCRGNVPTRLQKLHDEDEPYQALILAAAGLERLGKPIKQIVDRMRLLSRSEMLPAPGQGALAVVCRKDRDDVRECLRSLDHPPSRQVCTAERSFLNRIEGGCQAPVGALASIANDRLQLEATITDPEGRRQLEGREEGDPEDAVEIGIGLAEGLLERGARELLPS